MNVPGLGEPPPVLPRWVQTRFPIRESSGRSGDGGACPGQAAHGSGGAAAAADRAPWNSKHGSIRVRRAMIIMASAAGTPAPAIARLVAADEDTVRDVIHLFNEKGLAALDPQWAGGRPLGVPEFGHSL